MMDRLLETYPTKLRSKSGVTPPAQSPKLLQTREQSPGEYLVSSSKLSMIKRQNAKLYYLIEFMHASGCRISEALRLLPVDITYSGHVKIKASKGSANRIVFSGFAREYMISCKSNNVSPWAGYSRFFVYREFRKMGLMVQVSGNKNKSVTHAIRHVVAESMERAGMQLKDTAQLLGHKSENSTGYYHGKQTKRF